MKRAFGSSRQTLKYIKADNNARLSMIALRDNAPT